jgi:microcystin-dependent protein
MSSLSERLGLIIFDGADKVKRAIFNQNYKTIDEKVALKTDLDNLGNAVTTMGTTVSNHTGQITTLTNQVESLSGSSGTIDSATLNLIDPLGHCKEFYDTDLPARHLWANGCTIGDESSGATGRANSDTIDLFKVLWKSANNGGQIKLYDSTGAAVSKGTDAATDFAAHKQVSLPNRRDRVGIGIDTMGGTSAGVVANPSAKILGGTGGEESHQPVISEMAIHRHMHVGGPARYGLTSTGDPNGDQLATANGDAPYWSDTCGASQSISDTGGGQPFNIMQPWIACNYIMRF